MIDFVSILTKGGLVLWWYQDQLVNHLAADFASRINELIHSAIIEGKANFNKNNMTLKYTLDNEFDLIFVVGYQTTIKISYAEKFLDAMKKRFRDKYCQKLSKEYIFNLFDHGERKVCLEGWDSDFMETYDEFRNFKARNPTKMKNFSESHKSQKTIQSMKKDFVANQNQKLENHNKPSNSVDSSSDQGKGSSVEEEDDDENETENDENNLLQEMTIEERRDYFRMKQEMKKRGKNKKPGQFMKKPENKNKGGKKKTEWNDVRGRGFYLLVFIS